MEFNFINQITLLHLLLDPLGELQGVFKAGLCFIRTFDKSFLKSRSFRSSLSLLFIIVSLIHLVHTLGLQAFRCKDSPDLFWTFFFFHGLYIGLLMILRCQEALIF